MSGQYLPKDEWASLHRRLRRFALYRWWRRSVVGAVDHEVVIARIAEESGYSLRYLFMTMMSAGIAILGLLLSSPAVVIGAMLISPLMGPILGLGFGLAMFDFAEMRRALSAFAVGCGAAVLFTALIVTLSPLQAPTPEIIARTRPNLFDLAVALFAALAGTFAIIRGRGDTIVGVAIATALMPPLAVVGYGLSTWNLPVLGGSLALFLTNFVTIALAAMAMARFYGFGHYLSGQQSLTQTAVLLAVFLAMAIPLGISLRQIASEAVAVSQVRTVLSNRFGSESRVTQLDVRFDRDPLVVRAVVIAPRPQAQQPAELQRALTDVLRRPVRLQLDQVLLEAGAGALEAQRAELHQARDTVTAESARISTISNAVALAAGTSVDAVIVDRDRRRVSVAASPLDGATLGTYRALEQRARQASEGWDIAIVPPQAAMPRIRFADNADGLDVQARNAVTISAWAARRWNIRALAVPGLPEEETESPSLSQRRGLAIATLLREQGVSAVPAPPEGQSFQLRPAAQAPALIEP